MDDHALVFTDLHNVLALARAKRFDDAQSYIASMETLASRGDSHLSQVIRRVGIPLCESFVAFEKGDDASTLDTILRTRTLFTEVGASSAQRDLIWQIAAEAAKRSRNDSALRILERQREIGQRLAKRSVP